MDKTTVVKIIEELIRLEDDRKGEKDKKDPLTWEIKKGDIVKIFRIECHTINDDFYKKILGTHAEVLAYNDSNNVWVRSCSSFGDFCIPISWLKLIDTEEGENYGN